MPKGGARARSGPAPDPKALRREREDGQWTKLPAKGREEPPPEWPLTRPTARERKLWERLWTTRPQAVMWNRLSQEIEVALYVRRLAEAEKRGSRVTLSTLVRQMADSLGLTPAGLARNRWLIVHDEVGERRTEAASSQPARPPSRERFAVVRDGAGPGGA